MEKTDDLKKLARLRDPFKPEQIGKLPKPSKRQTEEVKKNYKAGIRCNLCGGWHHPSVVHLDYVGHAAVTDRLLEVDPFWTWEPLSIGEDGLPVFDGNGGLWIKLTILGQERFGYGHPDNKKGGDAIKEAIGDAIRNGAMRFGVALDLWHKGDLLKSNDHNDLCGDKKSHITKEQVENIKKLVEDTGTKGHQLLKYVKADCYEKILSCRYDEVVKILQGKL
jgi:hypothetical protein